MSRPALAHTRACSPSPSLPLCACSQPALQQPCITALVPAVPLRGRRDALRRGRRFQLLNYRANMAFALLHNGTTAQPVVSAISAPIAVANPNEPTGQHLTLTTDPTCAPPRPPGSLP